MINPDNELFKWGPIDGRPIYMDAFVQAFVPYPKVTGISFPDVFGFLKDDKCVFIADYADLRNKGESAFRKYVLDDKRLKDSFNKWMKVVNRLKKAEERANRGLFHLSDDELKTFFVDWDALHIDFWITGYLPEFGNWGGEQLLKRKLLEFDRVNFIEIFEALSAPKELSFFQKEELEFMRLRLLSDNENLLGGYQKKYYWLRNNYGATQVLDIDFFRSELKKISRKEAEEKISEINDYANKVMAKKKNIIQKYRISEEIANIAHKLAYCVWWQDFRKQFIFIANHILTKFLEEISKRKKVPFKELCYYCSFEIIELLEKNKIVDAKKRFNGFIMYYHENKNITYMSGKEASDFAKPYIEVKVDRNIKEFLGLVVSKGKRAITEGRVKILFTPKNPAKMREGDILVAPMTSPDYIIAMRKSSAIITDEGGMTSHAAIVSRELGKPCIVGTKIATKLLKDNDFVEVDTNRGIVRKIK